MSVTNEHKLGFELFEWNDRFVRSGVAETIGGDQYIPRPRDTRDGLTLYEVADRLHILGNFGLLDNSDQQPSLGPTGRPDIL